MRITDLPPHLQAYARAQLAAAPAREYSRNKGPRPHASAPPATTAADWPPIVITVPMPPTVANRAHGKSRHWRAVDRERREYLATLDGLLVAGRLPSPPSWPHPRAWLRSSMVLLGAMDDDGAVSRHKWPIDWLVSTGYLASDRRTCLRWAAMPDQRVTRKEPPTITLTIAPLD